MCQIYEIYIFICHFIFLIFKRKINSQENKFTIAISYVKCSEDKCIYFLNRCINFMCN